MKTIPSTVILVLLFALFAGHEATIHAQKKDADPNVVYDPSLFADLEYRCIGPSRGGRVTAVTGIASQPSTFFMGATGGGVWKTTDYGQSWVNVSDGTFETGSIGAIRTADSDPNIVYVGTGSDGLRSNVITGRGVYKSTDGGKTWEFVGLRNTGQIGAVEIHPQNPDLVFVAAIGHAFGPNPDRGVYRSRDGGKNWERVFFVSDSTGAVDLEFAPDNPQEMYASMWRAERKPWTIISGGREGGVYKSSDGGDSWTQLDSGLPRDLIGKSDLAVSPADPDRVYVLIEAPVGEGGVYRSDDRGQSFRLVSTQASLLDRPFYYCNIDADPTNADILYVNSQGFFKSTDGGETWQRIRTPHGDNHDMWINPNNPDVFIQSNDGGVNVTRDGGATWSTQLNQPTAELYQVAVDDQFPYWVYAGQQDNSTIMVPSLPPYSPAVGPMGFWRAIGGCETGPAVPKPGNHNIVYANCKGRFGRYNKLTGQEKQYYVGAANLYSHNPRDLKYRFQRVSPIHVSPHNPDVVYHASQYLHRTTDEGVTWETLSPDLTANDPTKQVISGSPITRDITGEEFYSTIYAVQESPLEKGLIWVGANDGPIHVTRDGGRTWTKVTPHDLPPGGRVQTIEPSPHRANKAYVAVYRYLLGDWQPYIYRTDDYGQSWTRLTTGSNGIPADSPTRAIREDPHREGLLYAGTEFGMFVSFDEGVHWQSFQHNLPATPVTDIKVYRKDIVLSTMGRSFWILDNLTPLHQLSDQVAASSIHLYAPRDAYRMRYRSSGRSSGDLGYPPPGVAIDYYLSKKSKKEVILEIMNTKGQRIRAFSSEKRGGGQKIPELTERGDFSLEHVGGPKLSKDAGMHRFVWDMRYAGPWDSDEGRSGRSGPMVIPGSYQARLTVGKWIHAERFEVRIDPRIVEDGITRLDLVAQASLSLKIRDALSLARVTAEHLREAREKLEKIIEKGDNNVRRAQSADDKLATLQVKLVTAEGRYQQPMLIDQLSYLYRMLDRADQKPGRDAYRRLDELNGVLSEVISELKLILEEDISQLD
jgi:photosystem II stability/assembly factor-like uncharacterized protein